MACCFTKSGNTDNSKEIEFNLKQWKKNCKKAIKILLLGSGESGKTTIIKQMKILHVQGFNESERKERIGEIRQNIVEVIVNLLDQMKCLQIPFADEQNVQIAETLGRYVYSEDLAKQDVTVIELFEKIRHVWKDEGVQTCFHRCGMKLPDFTRDFLDRADHIGKPSYCPTDHDILQSRRTTTDIQKIEFDMKIPQKYGGGSQTFWMYDVGGQRGERRKWIQVFDRINTILFLVACNTFDQVDVENPTLNRLQESIELFQDVWNSRFLQESGFILFLNKQDLLKKKVLSGISIGDHFPEYSDYAPEVEDEYIRTRCFIRDLFQAARNSELQTPTIMNQHQLKSHRFAKGNSISVNNDYIRDCFMHFTTATDTKNVETVFKDVHHFILSRNLAEVGLQ